MKLKTVVVGDKTYAEVLDGKPVFIEDGGSEVAFDAPGTKATISRLNGEAKTHREAKEAAEAKLKGFDGIADPAAALKALETISNIDQKKLIDAGQVETLKATIAKGYEDMIAAAATTHATELAKIASERDGVTKNWHTDKINAGFTGSKFIADKFAIPADLVQARFSSAFKVEDGKIVAVDAAGNKIFSKARPGEIATFDEALDVLVDSYPYKNDILKGKGGGAGSGPGNGGPGNSGKTISRAEFGRLSPADQMAKTTKEGFTVTD